MWGGIATGIFGEGAVLKTQLIGVGAMVGWSLVVSGITFFLLKAIGLLRVDAEEEIAGLDICEHGMYAYPAALVAASSTEAMGGGSAGSVGGAPVGGVSVAAH
jgi:Amt family ammonium transporter